jgi:hypothetical protein
VRDPQVIQVVLDGIGNILKLTRDPDKYDVITQIEECQGKKVLSLVLPQ